MLKAKSKLKIESQNNAKTTDGRNAVRTMCVCVYVCSEIVIFYYLLL